MAAYRDAFDSGASADQIREVILTAHLFDGYPTALEGFRLLEQITPILVPSERSIPYSTENISLWSERGRRLCRNIYGPQFAELTRRVAEFAPELYDSMIVEGYGKVLARPNLDIASRELCIVAILATKRRPRQMLSHALGSLRVGASTGQLRSVADTLPPELPESQKREFKTIIEHAIQKYEASI